MKGGESDIKCSESRGKMSERADITIEPESKRVKPDVLLEMGLAMLDDDDEPLSVGDTQTVVSSPYSNAQTRLLNNVCEDVRAFSDPFGDEYAAFRRQKSTSRMGEDHFRKLSDEIVLGVFRWLPKVTLKRCALVCRRWRNIAYDEELWTRVDLGSKTLSPGRLGDVVKRGARILRLAQTDIPDPVFCPNSFTDDYVSKIQFLDLSLAVISEKGLALILQRTKHLIKLSLEHCRLNDEVCQAITQNPLLEVLNLTMVYNLTSDGLRTITSSCRRLVALNIGWANLDVEALDKFVSCLPPNLSQLNISGCRHALLDRHVSQLVKGCPKLTELDISDASEISSPSIDAICQLKHLEHLSLSRCYHVNSQSLPKLGIIASLRYLNIFGLQMDVSSFLRHLPEVEFNKFTFSSIARPTVGIRRTSIWGLRVRD